MTPCRQAPVLGLGFRWRLIVFPSQALSTWRLAAWGQNGVYFVTASPKHNAHQTKHELTVNNHTPPRLLEPQRPDTEASEIAFARIAEDASPQVPCRIRRSGTRGRAQGQDEALTASPVAASRGRIMSGPFFHWEKLGIPYEMRIVNATPPAPGLYPQPARASR